MEDIITVLILIAFFGIMFGLCYLSGTKQGKHDFLNKWLGL